MECQVWWNGGEGMSFTAESGSGHLVNMDGAPEGGGRNLAPRPMELVLIGSAGCTAYDVVLILRKSGQQIHDCRVQVKAERAPTDPKVFTQIHLEFHVSGKDLSMNLVERAVKLSHDKYCSATIMLSKTAVITYSVVLSES